MLKRTKDSMEGSWVTHLVHEDERLTIGVAVTDLPTGPREILSSRGGLKPKPTTPFSMSFWVAVGRSFGIRKVMRIEGSVCI